MLLLIAFWWLPFVFDGFLEQLGPARSLVAYKESIARTFSNTFVEAFLFIDKESLVANLYGSLAVASSLLYSLVVVISLMEPILTKRTVRTTACFLLFLLALSMSMGMNSPLFVSLKSLVPLLEPLRTPSRFLFVAGFFVSILFARGSRTITERVEYCLRRTVRKAARISCFSYVCSVSVLVILTLPVVATAVGIGNTVSPVNLNFNEYLSEKDFSEATSFFKRAGQLIDRQSRIITVPRASLRLVVPELWMNARVLAWDPIDLPTFTLQSRSFSAYLNTILSSGDLDGFSKFCALINVGYVLVKKESSTQSVIDSLEGTEHFTVILENRDYVLLRNPYNAPRFYVAKPLLAVGGPKLLFYLSRLSTFDPNISKWALVYSHQLSVDELHKSFNEFLWIALSEDYLHELAFQSLRTFFVYPSLKDELQSTGLANYSSTNERIASGNLLYSVPIVTIAEDDHLSIDYMASTEGWFEIWARIDTFGGTVTLEIDLDNSLTVNKSNVTARGMHWTKLGTFYLEKSKHRINLSARNGSVDLDVLLVSPTGATRTLFEENLQRLRRSSLKHIIVVDRLSFSHKNWNLMYDKIYFRAIEEASVDIVKEDFYQITARIKSPATFFVDGRPLCKVENRSDSWAWRTMPMVKLGEGQHTLTILYRGSSFDEPFIDQVLLFQGSEDLNSLSHKEPIKSVVRKDASHFLLELEADQPLFLINTESYFPEWYVEIRGKSSRSVAANWAFNGYFIDTAGQQSALIGFDGTSSKKLGLFVSAVSLISILALNTPVKARRFCSRLCRRILNRYLSCQNLRRQSAVGLTRSAESE